MLLKVSAKNGYIGTSETLVGDGPDCSNKTPAMQAPHIGGVPWGAPPPLPFFPGGDHGPGQQAWAPPVLEPVYPTPQFAPHPPIGGIHGRPQPQADAHGQRLKDEQRRRQHEYSQALAEQVRQREQQKQREREARLRQDAAFEAQAGARGQAVQAAPALRDRGLFGGLGEHNQHQRTNFGRGRREPVQAGAPPYLPPQQHHPTIEHQPQPLHPLAPSMETHNVQYQPQAGWSGHAEALGLVQPPQHHSGNGGLPVHQDAHWNQPSLHQVPPSFQVPQFPAHSQAPPAGGRRIRTDLHNGGGAPGDDMQKQLRQQQQLDMQETLRRQIEDKQRQKLEEKRKREEDERREMEKFEQEKRRQHEEQERLKEERRRKAQADEEHFRLQQQQLAAANAAAQEQRHHQRHHHSPSKNGASQNLSPHSRSRHELPTQIQPPGLSKRDPFTNSRAHLFQDPPSPQQQSHHQAQIRHSYHQFPQPNHHVHDLHHPHGELARANRSVAVPVDTHLLMEQYEQVRVELERQRHLVEQLHAQMQQQQQRPPRAETPRELPTISDLERLRQELRDELEQREAQHREELEALRRQQRSNELHLQLGSVTRQQLQNQSPPRGEARDLDSGPARRKAGRRHDAFVQDALNDEDEQELTSMRKSYDASGGNQNPSPSPFHQQGSKLRGSRSTTSLQCESQLVFFDGRVDPHEQPQPTAQSKRERMNRSLSGNGILLEEPEQDDNRLEDSVDELAIQLRTSAVTVPAQIVDNQEEARSPAPPRKRTANDDDDELGFFIRRFDSKDLEPQRYTSSLLSSHSQPDLRHSPEPGLRIRQPQGLAILEDVDNDNDENGSLDGDTLEAIFERNLRRHEILTGFEAQSQHHPPGSAHWQELHRKLRAVPEQVAKRQHKTPNEPSLAASSRWMPSSGNH